MLHCEKLTFIHEDRILFNDLSFTVAPGAIVHLEGANGVGKTSLLRVLVGLSTPTAGAVFWQGKTISAERDSFHQQLLYIGHKTGIKPELTALENLQFFQTMQPIHLKLNLWDILAKVGLAGYEDITSSQLSAGQKRRVALARLWLTDCPLWVLDEPFAAIDRSGIAVLEALFIKHAQKGGMVLLTTHQDLTIDSSLLSKIILNKAMANAYV